eukprot:SM000207S06182  [mRNA]  locus=s207:232659:234742:+ [translate_table: standard]
MAAAGSPPARTCGRVLAMGASGSCPPPPCPSAALCLPGSCRPLSLRALACGEPGSRLAQVGRPPGPQRSGGAGAARRLQLAAGGTGLGAAPSTSREGLKDLIKQITTGTDRGKPGAKPWELAARVGLMLWAPRLLHLPGCLQRTSYQQRQRALELLQALEKCNPTSDPIMSPLVSGTWTLLYTAPTDEATVDKFAGTEEGPFLARIKPAAFGSVKQTGSTQVIDTNRMKVDNIANFSFFGMPGSLCINGSFEKSPPIPGRGAVRLNVVFDKFVLRVGPLGPITIPLGWIQPKGWIALESLLFTEWVCPSLCQSSHIESLTQVRGLSIIAFVLSISLTDGRWVDTTYLDEDLRIGRGDKGSIFVATRPQRRKPQSN